MYLYSDVQIHLHTLLFVVERPQVWLDMSVEGLLRSGQLPDSTEADVAQQIRGETTGRAEA